MKNKKSIAMAMAAVSTLGAVAPAFANEVAPLALTDLSVDYRLANGEELVKNNKGKVLVLEGRSALYNDNFTPDDKSDDTFKNEFKDATILVSRYTNDNKDDNDLYVLVKKATDQSDITMEKAQLEAMIAEIKKAKEEGATVEVGELEKAKITDKKKFEDSQIKVTVTDKEQKTPKEYIFNGVPGVEEEVVVVNPFEGLTNTANVKVENKKNITAAEKEAYYALNKFKLVAEQNKDKFDFVKEQDETTPANLLIKVYKKDDKVKTNPVFTMTLENFAELEKTLVVNIPQTNDFAGHWAQKEIVEAMLKGQVDVAENFRPQDGIKRAEFAKIVCTMFGIEPKDTDSEPFHDVSKADGWKYDYIAALYTQGSKKIKVIQGSDDKFRPDDKISREEVAVILAKMISEKDKDAPVADVNGNLVHGIAETKFDDTKDIAPWADDSVKFLSSDQAAMYDDENYVVQGDQNKFNPKQEITRAEALVMIERAAIAKNKK